MADKIDTSPEAVEMYIHRANCQRRASIEKGLYASARLARDSIELTRALSARVVELENQLASS